MSEIKIYDQDTDSLIGQAKDLDAEEAAEIISSFHALSEKLEWNRINITFNPKRLEPVQ